MCLPNDVKQIWVIQLYGGYNGSRNFFDHVSTSINWGSNPLSYVPQHNAANFLATPDRLSNKSYQSGTFSTCVTVTVAGRRGQRIPIEGVSA